MELTGLRKTAALSLALLAILLFGAAESLARTTHSGKTITVKVTKDTSLDELIASSGYDIDDKDIPSFLNDLVSLNKHIESPRFLPKGTSVRLPLRYLKAARTGASAREQRVLPPVKDENGSEERVIRKERVVSQVKTLLERLNEDASISSGEFKVLSVGNRSRFSFDTSFFPVLSLPDRRVVVLDYRGILPEEIKDIVELAWPEYRITTNRGPGDLKGVVASVLDSLGYSPTSDAKIVLGGALTVELLADFVMVRKGDDIESGDIVAVSVISGSEYRTPAELEAWAKRTGIRMVELYMKVPPLSHGRARVFDGTGGTTEAFTEKLLGILGLKAGKGKSVALSKSREYEFSVTPDFVVTSDGRTKLINFSDISEPVVRYAKKRGFDMVSIDPSEERGRVITKVLDLLSFEYEDRSGATSPFLTPKKVKYRIKGQGIVVKSKKGMFFLTDGDIGDGLLSALVDSHVTVVKY